MTTPVVPPIVNDAIPVGATGKNLNVTDVTTSSGVVANEVVVVGDPSDPAGLTRVQTGQPNVGDYGTTVRQATDYTIPNYDRTADEDINSTQDFVDPWFPKEFQDFFDTAGTNPLVYVPIQTSPAGIDTLGKTSASQSLPVTLANEDTLDKFIIAAASTPGSLGANVLSDVNGNSRPSLDCLQYRSISFQTTTPAGTTVTLLFEASNDNINFVNVPMFDAAAATTAPVLTVAQAAATTRYWVGPIQFRYFRARVSVAVAGGIVTAFTRLSMAPFSPVDNQVFNSAGNWSTNVAQVAGTAWTTDGVAGTPAVGGPIAAGVTPGLHNPLLLGGTDNSTTNAGAANPLTRILKTDNAGNQVIVGPQVVAITTNPSTTTQPVIVAGTQYPNSGTQQPVVTGDQNTTQANERLNELLTKVLLELKGVNFYLKELSTNLNLGLMASDEFPRDNIDDITASNFNLN